MKRCTTYTLTEKEIFDIVREHFALCSPEYSEIELEFDGDDFTFTIEEEVDPPRRKKGAKS